MTIEEYPFLSKDTVGTSGVGEIEVDYDGEFEGSLSALSSWAWDGAYTQVVRSLDDLDKLEVSPFSASEFSGCDRAFFDSYDLLLVSFSIEADPGRLVLTELLRDQEYAFACVAALPDYRKRTGEVHECRFAKALAKEHFYYGTYSYPRPVEVLVANAFGCSRDPAQYNVSAAMEIATDRYAPGFAGEERDYAQAELGFRRLPRDPSEKEGEAAAVRVRADENRFFYLPNVNYGLYRVTVDGVEGSSVVAVCPYLLFGIDAIDPEGQGWLYD